MTVERAHIGHATRYALRDGPALRCVLAFDTGEEGSTSAAWKVLLPGPAGTEDLYGTRQFDRPDADELTAWLAPIVGEDAAAELASAADASPPPEASWRRPTDR
jgi:hypothetical protein